MGSIHHRIVRDQVANHPQPFFGYLTTLAPHYIPSYDSAMDHESKPKKLFGLFDLRSKRKTHRDSVLPLTKIPLTQPLPESPKSLPSPRVIPYPAGPVDRMPHSQAWTHRAPSPYIEQGVSRDASSRSSLHEPHEIVGYRASV